jgi:hypothetical protein
MVVNMDEIERDLLINELEKATIPDLRFMIASGMRKNLRDELKKDEVALKTLLEKLKTAA